MLQSQHSAVKHIIDLLNNDRGNELKTTLADFKGDFAVLYVLEALRDPKCLVTITSAIDLLNESSNIPYDRNIS